MGGMNGNAAALARWRASKTPEELHAIMQKAAKKRMQTRMARLTERAAQTGMAPVRSIGITVQLREQGTYVAGSSQTFTLDGCPYDPEAIRQALVKLLPDVRRLLDHKDAQTKKETIRW